MSPFFANNSWQPEAYKTLRKDDIQAEQAILEAEKIHLLQDQLATDIQFMNKRSAAYANKKRSIEPGFKRGDKVYLLRKHIKTKRPSIKLDFKKLGPFKVLDKVSSVNYRLQLPKNSRLHLVFHISLLEPARGDAPIATDTELQPENELMEYEVEAILDRRLVGRREEFLIKWEGYEYTDNSWEPTGNISYSLIQEWKRRHPQERERRDQRHRVGRDPPRRIQGAPRGQRDQ